MNKPTVVKTTKTADNRTFQVWSDGTVTQALGYFWRGPRKLPMAVAFMVAEEAHLFNAAEVPALLKAAKRLNGRKASFNPGALRALAVKLLAA